ncbi:uncharacterized protein MONBRDRAFT_8812 [Monosiga brevicollis MX1]|uniref:Uncharacterized protein n=1 Tax=Monosiga brevicollis TaxID=81824 RepID=A9V172_MONBE|nr:uncharacterized protein MONBRDRAFT_8812 [Monosiga brevicollis MX1]EDQ88880.1 predicted protein [Monosiga brevicollis MX1]|eukprot:XP_001746493.1 hypothetical protein [Monosiga brevicollis MX1]
MPIDTPSNGKTRQNVRTHITACQRRYAMHASPRRGKARCFRVSNHDDDDDDDKDDDDEDKDDDDDDDDEDKDHHTALKSHFTVNSAKLPSCLAKLEQLRAVHVSIRFSVYNGKVQVTCIHLIKLLNCTRAKAMLSSFTPAKRSKVLKDTLDAPVFKSADGDKDLTLAVLKRAVAHAENYGVHGEGVVAGVNITRQGAEATTRAMCGLGDFKGIKWWWDADFNKFILTCADKYVHGSATTECGVQTALISKAHNKKTGKPGRLQYYSDTLLEPTPFGPDGAILVKDSKGTPHPLLILELEYGNRDAASMKRQVTQYFDTFKDSLRFLIIIKVYHTFDLEPAVDEAAHFRAGVVVYQRPSESHEVTVALSWDVGTQPLTQQAKSAWRNGDFSITLDAWTRKAGKVDPGDHDALYLRYTDDNDMNITLPSFVFRALKFEEDNANLVRRIDAAIEERNGEDVYDIKEIMSVAYSNLLHETRYRRQAYALLRQMSIESATRDALVKGLRSGSCHPSTAIYEAIIHIKGGEDQGRAFYAQNPFPLEFKLSQNQESSWAFNAESAATEANANDAAQSDEEDGTQNNARNRACSRATKHAMVGEFRKKQSPMPHCASGSVQLSGKSTRKKSIEGLVPPDKRQVHEELEPPGSSVQRRVMRAARLHQPKATKGASQGSASSQ